MNPSPIDSSDRELCERARRAEGGREAFAVLVGRYQPSVSRFVARSLRNRAEAEEVVQETFLRAWQQIARFRPETNFPAWVLTIARFLCMARRKDAKRHPPPAPLEEGREAALSSPGTPRDTLERLREDFASLPPHQREVVALRLFDDLSYREISRITGESEVTLRSRLHDALVRLKSIYGVGSRPIPGHGPAGGALSPQEGP